VVLLQGTGVGLQKSGMIAPAGPCPAARRQAWTPSFSPAQPSTRSMADPPPLSPQATDRGSSSPASSPAPSPASSSPTLPPATSPAACATSPVAGPAAAEAYSAYLRASQEQQAFAAQCNEVQKAAKADREVDEQALKEALRSVGQHAVRLPDSRYLYLRSTERFLALNEKHLATALEDLTQSQVRTCLETVKGESRGQVDLGELLCAAFEKQLHDQTRSVTETVKLVKRRPKHLDPEIDVPVVPVSLQQVIASWEATVEQGRAVARFKSRGVRRCRGVRDAYEPVIRQVMENRAQQRQRVHVQAPEVFGRAPTLASPSSTHPVGLPVLPAGPARRESEGDPGPESPHTPSPAAAVERRQTRSGRRGQPNPTPTPPADPCPPPSPPAGSPANPSPAPSEPLPADRTSGPPVLTAVLHPLGSATTAAAEAQGVAGLPLPALPVLTDDHLHNRDEPPTKRSKLAGPDVTVGVPGAAPVKRFEFQRRQRRTAVKAPKLAEFMAVCRERVLHLVRDGSQDTVTADGRVPVRKSTVNYWMSDEGKTKLLRVMTDAYAEMMASRRTATDGQPGKEYLSVRAV